MLKIEGYGCHYCLKGFLLGVMVYLCGMRYRNMFICLKKCLVSYLVLFQDLSIMPVVWILCEGFSTVELINFVWIRP